MAQSTLHVAMFPWFAMGHLTPFLHLANKFAERGHRVSFLLPTKAQPKLEPLNHYPDLVSFVPLVIPHVDGLPLGAETTADVPANMAHLLLIAMELMKNQVEVALHNLKPSFIFFDFAWWLPALTHQLGIKSIFYSVVTASAAAYSSASYPNLREDQKLELPPLQFRPFELQTMLYVSSGSGDGPSFHDIFMTSLRECDALAFRTCWEIEGLYCDFVESRYGKPVILSGPVLPDKPSTPLEERWSKWLGGFKAGSVVYCAFGSECVLEKDQFQELVLGFELTGLPFFVALKPPVGAATVEEALPEGFEERIKGRGIVHGGWVQQPLILGHPSVGCFVSHCGFGSMWESLMNNCQIVLLPQFADQFMHTRIMIKDLKVAMEVERREEDGWYTRENVCKVVKLVMDEESEVGREVRTNHAKWKELLLSEGLGSSYTDRFIKKLQDLLE